MSKDGERVQPNGSVQLSIPMPAAEGVTGWGVYHLDDGGNLSAISATWTDGKVAFETTGFSLYIFVEKCAPETPSDPAGTDAPPSDATPRQAP